MYSYLLFIIILVGPIFLAVGIVFTWKQWNARSGKRSPLNQKRIHLPGEQLRIRIDNLSDDISGYLLTLIMVGPYSLLVVLYIKIKEVHVSITITDALVAVLAVLTTAFAIRSIIKSMRLRILAREGLAAELITAQNLLPLVGSGCLVFNDVPAKSEGPNGRFFNIDHVVIGPNAVFMVETKSHKKPGKLDESWKVFYDGKTLKFPDYRDAAMLDQAKRQTKWLSDYLFSATGETVKIVPVLALPGWYIENTNASTHSDVIVSNCKNPKFMLSDKLGPSLDAAKKQRIAHALIQRYPELDV